MATRPPEPMPAPRPDPPVRERELPDWARPSGRSTLGMCLARLDEAIAFATALGVPSEGATSVEDNVIARMGFPADVYTLALVGGTGVGKSSLLNALAGAPVSAASVRRPTTDRPVAWIPAANRSDLTGLLAHLEVHEVREHEDGSLGSVAILDLPDMDSVEGAHRERVEALLPRVDAVVWVTDLEKYHDAVLHDAFLRRWIDRLARQLVVLNKADRLSTDDAVSVSRDLQLDLERLAAGGPTPDVIVASAIQEGRGGPGIAAIREWLVQGLDAKAIVRARLAASIAAAIDALATAAGLDPTADVKPLLDPSDRRRATDEAAAAVLRVVDIPGVERQGVAATRARARAKGAGPLGRLTSSIYRLSGREASVADPVGYLGRWRERGSLVPAIESITQAVAEPIRRAPPTIRPALVATVERERLESGLAAVTDRAVADQGREVPSSRVWPLLGTLQTLVTPVLVFAAAWLVLWLIIRFPVDEVVVPILGRLPMPLLILVVALFSGFLIARLLALHAGWLGRRWAGRLARDVRKAVSDEVVDAAFAPLDRIESQRVGLWTVARSAREDCRDRP